jgi:holin-like protein
MLGGLLSGVIKLEQVENAADFLVQIMPVFFIPAAVGLMDKFDTLRAVLLPFLVTLVVSLVFTMGTTGLVTQFFLRRERKGEKK